MFLSVESTNGVALIRNIGEPIVLFILLCYIYFNLN